MNWYRDKIKIHPKYKLNQIVSDLSFLYPGFAFLIIKTFALARREKLRVHIFETYRSQERQLDLFNRGRSKLRANGMHHFGVATDIIFLDKNNNPSWSDEHNWKRLGEIGKSFGLTWGGDWPWDKPHFQFIPVAAQHKIVTTNYPEYDRSIDKKISELLSLYQDAQAGGFSDESIKKILSCIEGELPQIDNKSASTADPLDSSRKSIFTRDLFSGCSGEDVRRLQQFLNTDTDTLVAAQGIGSSGQESDYFGDLTKRAVQRFQTKYNIVSAGCDGYGKVGLSTREKIQELCEDKKNASNRKVTIQQMAEKYNLDVASILAVAQVESGGRTGFQKTGLLTVLFEAHIFYQELKKAGLNPDVLMKQYPNLISPTWNRNLYKGGDAENTRLAEALKIHKCAWNCASYGKFQIMGFNCKTCGFDTAQDFVEYLKTGQEAHIEAFLRFVNANHKMMDALKGKDWPTFARLYNGSGYAQNRYDIKLAEAYKEQSAKSYFC